MKLTRRHLNVLKHLNKNAGWVGALHLPDGNGHCGGSHWASPNTLDQLCMSLLIERGKGDGHSVYGYRITDPGREALQSVERSEG